MLAALIERNGPLGPPATFEGPYAALVRAILGQQLSVRAAEAIYGRLLERFDGRAPTPRRSSPRIPTRCARPSACRARRSASCARWPSTSSSGELELDRIDELSDEEVAAELMAVKGIGVWTTQIFLIFQLARPDVLAAGDLGIRRAVQSAYALADLPSTAELGALADPWRPIARAPAGICGSRCVPARLVERVSNRRGRGVPAADARECAASAPVSLAAARRARAGEAPLGELLIARGRDRRRDAELGAGASARHRGATRQVLTAAGTVRRLDLQLVLAEQWDLPFVDLFQHADRHRAGPPLRPRQASGRRLDSLRPRGWRGPSSPPARPLRRALRLDPREPRRARADRARPRPPRARRRARGDHLLSRSRDRPLDRRAAHPAPRAFGRDRALARARGSRSR